jgi:hypothetical protein
VQIKEKKNQYYPEAECLNQNRSRKGTFGEERSKNPQGKI